MILQKHLIKESFFLTLIICVVLLAISMISQLNIYLLAVVSGNLQFELLIPILLSFMPQYLSIVLPLAFFLAVIITLNRMQVTRELVVLSACGIDRHKIAIMLLPIVIFFFGCALALSLFITPFSARKAQEILNFQQNLDTLDTIVPQTFIKINDTTTIYTEGLSENKKQLNHVYILNRDKKQRDKNQIIYAPKASLIHKDGLRHVQLDNGYLIQATPGSADIVRTTFEKLLIKLPPRSIVVKIERKEALDNAGLLASNDPEIYQFFFWRVTIALCLPVLFIIAMYMFTSRFRQDSSGKNFLVLFLSSLFYMGGNVVVFSLASDDLVSPEIGYTTVHILGLIVAGGFYRLRVRGI